MLSAAFTVCGLYKIIETFINKVKFKTLYFEIFLGAFLTTIGILLLLVPVISLLWLVVFIGVYFILDSIYTFSVASQLRNVFNFSSRSTKIAPLISSAAVFPTQKAEIPAAGIADSGYFTYIITS